MKAIILERQGEFAAALREDGTIVKTLQAGDVGDEIELEAELIHFPLRSKRLTRAAVAAVAAVMILGGSSTYVFAVPAAYVSFDAGESSVELAVNRAGRVISVKPTSADDAPLAKALNAEVRGKRVEDAMAQTMTLFREQGYLDGQGGAIIAGVTSGSEKRADTLTEALENAATHNGEGIPLYTMDVSPKEREEAKAQDVSGGRFVYERDGHPAGETQTVNALPSEQTEAPRETVPPAGETAVFPSPDAKPAVQTEDTAQAQPSDPPRETPAAATAQPETGAASIPSPTGTGAPGFTVPPASPENSQGAASPIQGDFPVQSGGGLNPTDERQTDHTADVGLDEPGNPAPDEPSPAQTPPPEQPNDETLPPQNEPQKRSEGGASPAQGDQGEPPTGETPLTQGEQAARPGAESEAPDGRSDAGRPTPGQETDGRVGGAGRDTPAATEPSPAQEAPLEQPKGETAPSQDEPQEHPDGDSQAQGGRDEPAPGQETAGRAGDTERDMPAAEETAGNPADERQGQAPEGPAPQPSGRDREESPMENGGPK